MYIEEIKIKKVFVKDGYSTSTVFGFSPHILVGVKFCRSPIDFQNEIIVQDFIVEYNKETEQFLFAHECNEFKNYPHLKGVHDEILEIVKAMAKATFDQL